MNRNLVTIENLVKASEALQEQNVAPDLVSAINQHLSLRYDHIRKTLEELIEDPTITSIETLIEGEQLAHLIFDFAIPKTES